METMHKYAILVFQLISLIFATPHEKSNLGQNSSSFNTETVIDSAYTSTSDIYALKYIDVVVTNPSRSYRFYNGKSDFFITYNIHQYLIASNFQIKQLFYDKLQLSPEIKFDKLIFGGNRSHCFNIHFLINKVVTSI